MFLKQPYEQMKVEFAKKIKEVLLRNHGVSTVEALDFPRRSQVQFLQKSIELLDGYKISKGSEKDVKPEELMAVKAQILTGLMYIISHEIFSTYTIRKPTPYGLHAVLQEVMGVTATNPLDEFSKRKMMEFAEKFLVSHMYLEGNLDKPMRAENPFAAIEAFSIQSFYERLITIRAQACQDKLKADFATAAQAAMPVAQGASTLFAMLPTFSLWSSGATHQSSHREETILPDMMPPQPARTPSPTGGAQ
jgi:hypothetical protein